MHYACNKRRPRKPFTDFLPQYLALAPQLTLPVPDHKLVIMASESASTADVTTLITDMSNSLSSVRQTVKSLRENEDALDTKEGISLLSLKHNLLLFYLNTLSLITARRAIGHSLGGRSPPSQTIGVLDRIVRGNEGGDLVDALLEGRVVVEKMKALEARMRYQIDKLVRLAQESDRRKDVTDDPLAFRPNPQNFVDEQSDVSDGAVGGGTTDAQNGVYRPPRLAPVPYVESAKGRRKARAPIPSALSALPNDPARPHVESTSGLGSGGATTSGRAAYLKKLQEYEEENFSRLIMKKADAKRRARDEADLALGGGLDTPGRRRRAQAGTLEDAFGDVLRSIDRRGGRTEEGIVRDGYEELRKKGRGGALERSRGLDVVRKRSASPDGETSGARHKRTRFELEAKIAKKRLSRKHRLSR
ncbi:hypothetical protein AX15_003929 [Amanita polypyramis BW_CC]|nr:hypothetical protein AX15_003929 [Amanita polypyramis BW_CC]